MALTDPELYNQFLADVAMGQNFSNQYIPTGILGRVTPGITPEEAQYLTQVRAQAQPIMNPALGTADLRRTEGGLNGLAVMGQGYNNTIGQQALQSLQGLGNQAAKGDKDVNSAVGFAKNYAATSGALPSYMQDAIAASRMSLGGLNDKQNLAIHEQGLRQANQDFTAASRQAQGVLGGSFARGGAGNDLQRQISQDYGRNLLQANQQRELANVDVQNQRMGLFNNLSTAGAGLEQSGRQAGIDLYGRLSNEASTNRVGQAANIFGNLGGLSETLANQQFTSQLGANQAIANTNIAQQEANRQNALNWTNTYGGTLSNLGQSVFSKDIFNLGQQRDEVTAQLGALLGIPQYLTAGRGTNAGIDIANQQLAYMRGR